jgi:hypothetical protein
VCGSNIARSFRMWRVVLFALFAQQSSKRALDGSEGPKRAVCMELVENKLLHLVPSV